MKALVTQYHALTVKELAQGGWLYPFSKYDWVWRTNTGTQETGVTVTVLQDSLQLVYLMGTERIQHEVQLTYSIGPHVGNVLGLSVPPVGDGWVCCITGFLFAVGSAASWSIPPSTDRAIEVTAVAFGW